MDATSEKVWITIRMQGAAMPQSPVQVDIDALGDTIVYASEIGATVTVLEDETETPAETPAAAAAETRTATRYEVGDDARWRNVDGRRWVIDSTEVRRMQLRSRS